MTLHIGDIRYAVFTDPDSRDTPWICRLKVEGITPAGRKISWRLLDGQGAPVKKINANHATFSETPDEAITSFQRSQVFFGSFLKNDEERDKVVWMILQAELLRERSLVEVEGN